MTTPALDTWTTTRRRIPWEAASSRGPVMPLGRNVYHDSRNLAYPWQPREGRTLTSQLWTRHGAILDQGAAGSCTGNEQTGALECNPCFSALPAAHPALDEALAVKIYSAAETIDGDGPFPPNDNGSSGPSAAKAAKNLGLISGYLHCLSLAAVLDALEEHPVGLGINWYEGYDSPDSSGHVTISGSVRGGHEIICRGKDVSAQVVFCDNSWGAGWGNAGSFSFSWADLDRLLHEQGDGTVSLPLTTPVPVPVPVPVPPVPGPDNNPDDDALALATSNWARGHHTGANERAARAIQAWLTSKGF